MRGVGELELFKMLKEFGYVNFCLTKLLIVLKFPFSLHPTWSTSVLSLPHL